MAKGVSQSVRHSVSTDRREGLRKEVGKQSSVRLTEIRAEIIVEVRDISAQGCRVTSNKPIPMGTEVVVGLGGAGSVKGRVVNNRLNDYGIEFDRTLNAEELALAFSGTQVITLFAAPEVKREQAEAQFSTRTKVLIIAALAIVSWASLIGGVLLGRSFLA